MRTQKHWQPLEQAIKSNLEKQQQNIIYSNTARGKSFKNEIWCWNEYDHTLEEVGLQFSVTRERIRQIEAKSSRKLKHPSRSKQLKSS